MRILDTIGRADHTDIMVAPDRSDWIIAPNVVTDAKLRDSAALSVIGRAANTAGDPADIVAGADAEVLRRSGTAIGFGTVATAGITDDAVTYAKMQNVSAASRLLGRGAGAGAGDVQEITLGANLSMVGTSLVASGGGGGGGGYPAALGYCGIV